MPDPASDRGRARSARELGLAGLHLLVLSSFALAQPLFSLLSENVVFFAARGSSRWEIVLFALGLVLVPPLLLLAVEALVGLVHRGAAAGLHLIFVGLLSGLVAMQVVNRIGDLPPGLFAALVVGVAAGAAVAYARLGAIRSVLTVLGPAPLLFLGLFLFGSPVAKLTLADDAQARPANIRGSAPVVMVVFDEFPSLSLLDRSGRIDPVRYPNFAALAGDATWFRNATTVQGNTSLAVPAILTGRYPLDREQDPDRVRLSAEPLHASRWRLPAERDGGCDSPVPGESLLGILRRGLPDPARVARVRSEHRLPPHGAAPGSPRPAAVGERNLGGLSRRRRADAA